MQAMLGQMSNPKTIGRAGCSKHLFDAIFELEKHGLV